jgi:hypothetical protein
MSIPNHVRQNVIAWNEAERDRALSDADNMNLGLDMRISRANDADRLQRNIDSLQ